MSNNLDTSKSNQLETSETLCGSVETSKFGILQHIKSAFSRVKNHFYSDYKIFMRSDDDLSIRSLNVSIQSVFNLQYFQDDGESLFTNAWLLDLLLKDLENAEPQKKEKESLDEKKEQSVEEKGKLVVKNQPENTTIEEAENTTLEEDQPENTTNEEAGNTTIDDLIQIIDSMINSNDKTSSSTKITEADISEVLLMNKECSESSLHMASYESNLESDINVPDICEPLKYKKPDDKKADDKKSPVDNKKPDQKKPDQKKPDDKKPEDKKSDSTSTKNPSESSSSSLVSSMNSNETSSTKNTSKSSSLSILHPNVKKSKYEIFNKLKKMFKPDTTRQYGPPPIVEPRNITIKDIKNQPYLFQRQRLYKEYQEQEIKCKSQRFHYHYYWHGRLQDEIEDNDLKNGISKSERFCTDFLVYLKKIYQGKIFNELVEFASMEILEEPLTKAETIVLERNIEYYKGKVYKGMDVQIIIRDEERLIQRSPKFSRYYHTLEYKDYQLWLAFKESEAKYYNSQALDSKEWTHSPTHFEYFFS